jgi:hypothetical protein
VSLLDRDRTRSLREHSDEDRVRRLRALAHRETRQAARQLRRARVPLVDVYERHQSSFSSRTGVVLTGAGWWARQGWPLQLASGGSEVSFVLLRNGTLLAAHPLTGRNGCCVCPEPGRGPITERTFEHWRTSGSGGPNGLRPGELAIHAAHDRWGLTHWLGHEVRRLTGDAGPSARAARRRSGRRG